MHNCRLDDSGRKRSFDKLANPIGGACMFHNTSASSRLDRRPQRISVLPLQRDGLVGQDLCNRDNLRPGTGLRVDRSLIFLVDNLSHR
jgi:hypothetical protein